MVKKVLSLVLTGALLLTSAACGNTPAASAPQVTPSDSSSMVQTTPPAASGKKTQLTMGLWDKNQVPALEAMCAAFTAKNPNITVDIQVTPWSEYWTKLEAAATGGALPDVFWMHTNHFMKYAGNDILMDLTNIFEGTTESYSNYPEGFVNFFKYDGQQLGIPKDFDTIGLVYNKELFDAKGVAYPDDTWDWNKLLEASIKLTDPATGVYGFAAPMIDQEGYLNMIYQNEGYSVKDLKSGYDLPATQEAMQFYVDLQKKHKVSPSQSQFADISANNMFISGKAAMLLIGSYLMPELAANEEIKDKFDVAVLPKGKTRASIYNGLGWSAAKKSKNTEEVKLLLQFLGSKEANELQGKHGGAIPIYNGTPESWLGTYAQYNTKAFIEMLEYGVPYPTSKTKSKWIQIEKDFLMQIYNDKLSVADACNQIAVEMDKLLATEK